MLAGAIGRALRCRREQAGTFGSVRPHASEMTIVHVCDVLGDQVYESLAHKGETMTTTAIATYAYDQTDQTRAELEHPA